MLFTIGYAHRKQSELIKLLRQNEIDYLIDVRLRTESQNKPEYSGAALRDICSRIGADYEHHPEMAPPYAILDAYRAGILDNHTFVRYLQWLYSAARDYVSKRRLVQIEDIASRVELHQNTCIISTLPFHQPKHHQKMICHRWIISNLLSQATGQEVQHL